MKIVVLSPHRDDAAFSLALTIESWVGQGFHVDVLNCFTQSAYAPFSDVDSVHPNDRISYVTALRSREDATWCRQRGAKVSCSDMNLKDAPLRLKCSTEDVCSLAANPNDKAFAKIQNYLSRRSIDALVLPLGIGSHVDHVTARNAARLNVSPSALCAFYEDLPYAARPGTGEAIEEMTSSLGEDLTPGFVAGPVDTKDAIARKRRAALCYDSQIDDDVTDAIAQFCVRYGGRERLWVNRAWRTSELMQHVEVDLAEAS